MPHQHQGVCAFVWMLYPRTALRSIMKGVRERLPTPGPPRLLHQATLATYVVTSRKSTQRFPRLTWAFTAASTLLAWYQVPGLGAGVLVPPPAGGQPQGRAESGRGSAARRAAAERRQLAPRCLLAPATSSTTRPTIHHRPAPANDDGRHRPHTREKPAPADTGTGSAIPRLTVCRGSALSRPATKVPTHGDTSRARIESPGQPPAVAR